MCVRDFLRDLLRRVPLLGVLVSLVAGIVAAEFLPHVGLWVWAVGFGASFCVALAALRFGAPVSWIYACLSVVFFGALSARFHDPVATLPRGVRMTLEVELEQTPVWRGGRAMHTEGRVFGVDSGSAGDRVLVAFDTMWRFELGDRVRFTGYVNPVDSVGGSYARLMHSRGFTGRTYVSRYSAPRLVAGSATSFIAPIPGPVEGRGEGSSRFFFKRSQRAAAERLARLVGDGGGLSADELAVATAMTTGWRGGISRDLRSVYSRTGASHLLAVSGLHVGIIFLIINGLLYLLPLIRGGRALRCVLAVTAIWGYAALTGMSPSVIRAAVMFTGAQMAVAMGVTRSSANILCGTGVILLALRPGMVFDISFQLSFLAVAGIMCWFGSLFRLVESRWRVLNFLWSTLIIGFVASVATMPLVSHVFGVFSPLGVVLNPVLIVTAWFVVAFSVVWILFPFGFWAPFFGSLIGVASGLQNAVVQSVSSVPGVAVEFRLPLAGVFAVYGAMILVTISIARRRSGR